MLSFRKRTSAESTPPSSTTIDNSGTRFSDSGLNEPRAEDQALANLQNEMQDLKNSRNEERFLFLTVIVVGANAVIFSHVENWAGALVIGVIEVFGLAVVARKWSIEEVPQMLSKFLDRTADRVNPPSSGTSNDPSGRS